jgi:hypothetical protein
MLLDSKHLSVAIQFGFQMVKWRKSKQDSILKYSSTESFGFGVDKNFGVWGVGGFLLAGVSRFLIVFQLCTRFFDQELWVCGSARIQKAVWGEVCGQKNSKDR